MKIHYKQTGGFGGLTISRDVDTKTLNEAVAGRFDELAEAVVASKSARNPKARDSLLYIFTIDGEQRTFDDSTLTREATELSELLMELPR